MEWVDADYFFDVMIFQEIATLYQQMRVTIGVSVLVLTFVVVVGFFAARRMLRRVRQSV
jgi:hypothetical protein